MGIEISDRKELSDLEERKTVYLKTVICVKAGSFL